MRPRGYADRPMTPRLDCIVSPSAQAVLAGLGRTEDVMFSPSGSSSAIAGFRANRIAVFDVAIVDTEQGRKVVVDRPVEIESATLQNPHGLCFFDEATLAVANREGGVQVYAVPKGQGPGAVRPMQTIGGRDSAPIRTPGSVACRALDPRHLELLVCHNYSDVVTRHVLDRRHGFASVSDEPLLRRGLEVPDGICYSPDGTWIAVSSHNTHQVLLYRRTAALQPDTAPDAVLRNVICPHGVRFTRDHRHLLVADAHARYVNVYDRGAADWEGVHDPCRMFPVLDGRTYLLGRSNPEEGGPKGIDVDPGMRVLPAPRVPDAGLLRPRATAEPACAADNWHRRYVQWRLARAIHGAVRASTAGSSGVAMTRHGPTRIGWTRVLDRRPHRRCQLCGSAARPLCGSSLTPLLSCTATAPATCRPRQTSCTGLADRPARSDLAQHAPAPDAARRRDRCLRGTNGLIPLHGLQRTASVVTIHDLVHRFAPQTQLPSARWKQRIFQPLCARTADRLVAVSKTTAGDVARHYGRKPDAVIEPLAHPAFTHVDGTAADATLRHFGVATPYLLTVGTLEPRKNLRALVEAHAECTADGATLPTLVIAGGPGWLDERLHELLADPARSDRIRWLGFVPTESLVHLYARCEAFVMPSLYEGFGMPVLEAQLCGAPVIHGDHRSMTEAAGVSAWR